jgi:hypothetical protein
MTSAFPVYQPWQSQARPFDCGAIMPCRWKGRKMREQPAMTLWRNFEESTM